MDSSSAEAEKDGTAESERQPPVTSMTASPTSVVASPPVSDAACLLPADSSDQAPSQATSQHSDDVSVTATGCYVGGGETATRCDDVRGGETLTAVGAPNPMDGQSSVDPRETVRLQTFSCEDDGQTGDIESLVTNDIPVSDDPCSSKTERSTDDEYAKNGCDENPALQKTRCLNTAETLNTAEALTCQSEVVALTVCDKSQASTDRDHSLSSGDSTEMLTAPEQRISSAVDLEVTAASNVDKGPDLSQDHSDVVPQFHTESVVDKSQKHLLEGEESAVESVCTNELDNIESEGTRATSKQYDVGGSVPRDTGYSHTLMGDSQDDSSCGLVIDDDDHDDDEDVITLSEEYFMTSEDAIPLQEDSASNLVITNVCSVRDDGSFILDNNEDIHVTSCENGTNSGSNLPPSPPVHVPSTSVQQAVGPAEDSVTEPRSHTMADADRTSALSTHTPNRNSGSTSDAVGNSRSPELLEERTRYQREHSAEHTSASRGSTNQKGSKPKSSESLLLKLEKEDTGYDTRPAAVPENDTRPAAESIDVHATPDSCSQVTSVDSFSRKRPYSEVGTEEEKGDKAAKALKQHIVEITSSSHPANLVASRTDSLPTQAARQDQSSEALGTLSKSLIIPSNLIAMKSIAPPYSAATKKVVLTIPPSLGRNKIHGTQITTHILTGTSQNIGSQVVSSSKDCVSSTSIKAGAGPKAVRSPAQHKAGSAPRQELSVSMSDGSVKTFTIVVASSQQAQKTVSIEPVAASSRATEPCLVRQSSAVTPNCFMPVYVNSIIQGKDDKQKTAITIKSKYSLLQPAQTFPVCNGSVVSSEDRSAQSVSSVPPSTVVTASSMRTDPLVTASQTPVSSTRKPAPTTVVMASERTAPCKVVFRTPQVSVGTRAATHQTVSSPAVSVGSVTSQMDHPAALMPAPAAVSVSPILASGSKQHIRLDQVSADAKLSASDMAALIEGKNLVPSLEPRLQWGGGGGQSVYRCVECGLLYGTLVGYTAHVKRMSMVVRYACMLCRAALVFFNRCTFLAHLRKHSTCTSTGDQVLNLKSCTMSVSSLQAQLLPQAEAQYMDPMSINRNHPVSCAECQESFPNASRLAAHISAATHCSFEHACHHCKMQLPTPCALKAHLRLHHAKSHAFCAQPPYVCPECGLQFANQVSLYQHLYATCLHFNRCVSLTCFKCKEWFPTLESLEDHIFLTHPNNRRYQCTVCLRTYNTRLSFVHHIPQMHKPARLQVSYVIVSSCASCCFEEDFVEGRSHARKHVQMEQTQNQVEFSFTCLLCKNFKTRLRSGLVTHLNKKHAAYKFTCSICEQGFVMLSLLRAHVLWAHSSKAAGVERFQCCQCSAASLSGESALPHVMWHVVKKVTDLANPPPTLHVNKHSMDIIVPPGNVKDKQTYFCRSCGSVLLSSLDLRRHMKVKDHYVCVKFPTCPYCQRFDFASMGFFCVHTKTCIVECGDTEAYYYSDHPERRNRSRPPRGDNGCASDGKVGIEWEEQGSLESKSKGMAALCSSPAQSVPQSMQTSAACSALGSSHQARAHCGVSAQAGSPDAAHVTVLTSMVKAANRGPVEPRESTQRLASSSLPWPASGEKRGPSSGLNLSRQNAQGAGETPASSSCGQADAKVPQTRTIVVVTKNGKVVGHKEMKMMPGGGMGSSGKIKRKVPTQSKTAVGKAVPRPDVSKSTPPSAGQKPATSHGLPWSGSQKFAHVMTSGSSATHEEQHEDCVMAESTEEVTLMTPAMDSEEANGQQQLYHPCPLCGLTYASAIQLAEHRASVHRGEKTVLSCQLCEKKGKKMMLSRAFLKKHLVRRHNIAKPVADSMVSEGCGGQSSALTAPETPAAAATPAAVGSKRCSTDSESSGPSVAGRDPAVKRLRVAAEEGEGSDYVCAKCQFSSPGRVEFLAHIATHVVGSSLQCLECGLCFSAPASLKKHLLMVHKVRQPHAYLARHGITLPDLPPDLSSHMDTLAPLGRPEVVIRTAGPFRESFSQQASLQDRKEQEEKKNRAREGGGWFECTVCYKEFETEGALKAHMRSHGMAFIRSRRALPRQEGAETRATTPAKDSAGVGGTGDMQPGSEGTS